VSHRETEHLRVLIANERKDRLELAAPHRQPLPAPTHRRECTAESVLRGRSAHWSGRTFANLRPPELTSADVSRPSVTEPCRIGLS